MKNIFLICLAIGGLLSTTSCKKAAGDAAEVSESATIAKTVGIDLPVDVSSSVINWEGAKPTGTHTGTIQLSGGSLTIADNTITGGSFTIDM